MVYQRLWMVNSTLVLLAGISLIVEFAFWGTAPISGRSRRVLNSAYQEQPLLVVIQPESIYKNDLFNTYQEKAEQLPVKKNLSVPLPTPPQKKATTPPTPPQPQFLPQLPVTLKGIIRASTEEESVVIIADQTNKEQMYHVGDIVQDAQIIKISRNKAIFLRSNGQQETFFLRKPEKVTGRGKTVWSRIIKKIDANLYQIDHKEFSTEITSLGEIIELLHLGSAYDGDKIVGIRVGNLNTTDITGQLGLELNDIITAVNGIGTQEAADRMRIYEALTSVNYGDTIKATIIRNQQKITLSYAIKKLLQTAEELEKEAQEKAQAAAGENNLFKLGKKAQEISEKAAFQERHHTDEEQQQVAQDLRQRLTSNLEQRSITRRGWQ